VSVVARPHERSDPVQEFTPYFFTPRAVAARTCDMSKNSQAREKAKAPIVQTVVNPDAAGIDLAAEVHYVAVPADRDAQPVRNFGVTTDQLCALADWLKACRIQTVAMEATSVYWIPLFEILEARGFEVCLVNAQHVRHVPGRKSDVQDCQWLQFLHSVGLLHASFRPAAEVCAIRTLLRHRESLVQAACEHLLRVQKALDQMNVLLHRVVTDVTGETGLAILDAIVAGERDPQKLARHRNARCHSTLEEIARALRGDWKPEHLFTLRQSLAAWRYHHALADECQREIQVLSAKLDNQNEGPLPPSAKRGRQPDAEARTLLFNKLGVDVTAVDGVNTHVGFVFLTEVGPDLSKFAGPDNFCSWLGLCPNNKVSGNKRLARGKTRPIANRLSTALRMAAQSLSRVESPLGDWFRRMRAKLGPAGAVTAAAHKIARILFTMIKNRTAFDPAKLGNPDLIRIRKERALRKQAAVLGYSLQLLKPQTA
jgi:transposase